MTTPFTFKQTARRGVAPASPRPGFRTRREKAGFTLVETAVAAALITLFLSSLFLLNSLVLRMLRAGNETAAASQLLQARAEQIRMSNWLDLTNPSYLQNSVLAQTPGTSASITLASLTETISAGPYLLGATNQPAASYIFQRAPGGTITSLGGTGMALGTNNLLQYTVTEHWNGWGGRTRERTIVLLASSWGIGQL